MRRKKKLDANVYREPGLQVAKKLGVNVIVAHSSHFNCFANMEFILSLDTTQEQAKRFARACKAELIKMNPHLDFELSHTAAVVRQMPNIYFYCFAVFDKDYDSIGNYITLRMC